MIRNTVSFFFFFLFCLPCHSGDSSSRSRAEIAAVVVVVVWRSDEIFLPIYPEDYQRNERAWTTWQSHDGWKRNGDCHDNERRRRNARYLALYKRTLSTQSLQVLIDKEVVVDRFFSHVVLLNENESSALIGVNGAQRGWKAPFFPLSLLCTTTATWTRISG